MGLGTLELWINHPKTGRKQSKVSDLSSRHRQLCCMLHFDIQRFILTCSRSLLTSRQPSSSSLNLTFRSFQYCILSPSAVQTCNDQHGRADSARQTLSAALHAKSQCSRLSGVQAPNKRIYLWRMVGRLTTGPENGRYLLTICTYIRTHEQHWFSPKPHHARIFFVNMRVVCIIGMVIHVNCTQNHKQ